MGELMSIMLVDDEIEILEAVSRVLKSEFSDEYNVFATTSSRDAKHMLQTQLIDILITDINMPGIDGFALSKIAKENNPSCKVIFFTGYSNFDYAYHAIKYGCDDFILKVSNNDDIIASVKKTMSSINKEITNKAKLKQAERVIALEKPSTKDETTITFIKNYIWENLHQEISLYQLSRLVFLNPSYLSRIFSQTVGVTLTEYVQNARIKVAKELLVKSDLQIQEIAMKVGLDSPAYFSRMFRKEVGLSPHEYRNQHYGP
jgi:two-component system response regulator YesN